MAHFGDQVTIIDTNGNLWANQTNGTAWDSESGGNQVPVVDDSLGAGTLLSTDAHGGLGFSLADGTINFVWVDFGFGRRKVIRDDVIDLVTSKAASIADLYSEIGLLQQGQATGLVGISKIVADTTGVPPTDLAALYIQRPS